MNEFLKKYPVPITGLILGLAAAGNLIQSYGNVYRNTLGIISFILLIFMLAKIAKYPKDVAESLNNPVIGSVFPTFSMAIMILATYLKPYAADLSLIVWIIGFVLHIILILWFTKKFVVNFNIKKVFPSWFIVYVGIVVACVTGPIFKLTSVCKVVFWFGLATYLILLPIVVYRVIKVKEVPEPVLPTFIIFSAPASLLLAGYMNSFGSKSMILVWFLMILSLTMYAIALILLPKLLKLKFYPSYSAFTFPLIISGISIKLTNAFLIKSGQPISALGYLVKIQEAIGIVIVLYVLIRYILFLLPDSKAAVNIKSEAK
jgi:exfoliative toxin A/B